MKGAHIPARLTVVLAAVLLHGVAFGPSRDVVAQEEEATPTIANDASPVSATPPAAASALAEFVGAITLESASGASAASGVAVADDGTLYVVDSLGDQIEVFDRDGKAVATWGERGDGPGQFRFSSAGYWGDVALGPDGNLYIVDSYNNRVQVLGPDGRFLRQWGEFGTEAGQLIRPIGIAIDGAGDVYVTESGNQRVQVFDSDGRSRAVWELPVAAGGPFQEPADIAFDTDGTAWITDWYTNRVYHVDHEGNVIGAFGQIGVRPGRLFSPWGIAVDARGNLAIADYGAHRVQVFAPDGTLLGVIGSSGTDPGEFDGPIYLTIGPDGLLYVADEGNQRVQKFRFLPPLADTPA